MIEYGEPHALAVRLAEITPLNLHQTERLVCGAIKENIPLEVVRSAVMWWAGFDGLAPEQIERGVYGNLRTYVVDRWRGCNQ